MSAAELALLRPTQNATMLDRCTILVAGTETRNAAGIRIRPYSPTAYDAGLSIPCRVAPVQAPERKDIGDVAALLEKWTVTVAATTDIKERDRLAILGHVPAVLDVEFVSNGDTYETARVLICVKAS